VALVRAAVEAMAEAEVSIGSIPITRAAEIAPKLQTLMSAVSQGFDQIKPAEAEGFEERTHALFPAGAYRLPDRYRLALCPLH
jgi:hypothetical protein